MAVLQIEEKIEQLIAPSLESMGYELVRVKFSDKGGRTLQIMAERPDEKGMTVDDCASISRTISAILDVEDPIADEYNLEVSSPGMDRPLVKQKDFVKFAGQHARIVTSLPVDGSKKFRAKLLGVEGDKVLIALADQPDKKLEIDFNNITSAKLLITDEMIGGSKKKKFN